jgi:hypothetical protein
MNGEQAPRSCGDCNACCEAPPIHDGHFRKPRGVLCREWRQGTRCGIYQTRPAACQDYLCAYLRGDFEEGDRPDKTGVLIDYMDTPPTQLPVVARFYGLVEGALVSTYTENRVVELARRGVEAFLLIDVTGRMGLGLIEDVVLTAESAAFFRRLGCQYVRRIRRLRSEPAA